MKRWKNNSVRRLLAMCMAFFIVFALLPVQAALAAKIDHFTVTLQGAPAGISGGNIAVTLTETLASGGADSMVQEVPETGGDLVLDFAGFVDDDTAAYAYKLTVTGMSNYDDYQAVIPASAIAAESFTVSARALAGPYTITLEGAPEGIDGGNITVTLTETLASGGTEFRTKEVQGIGGDIVIEFEDFVDGDTATYAYELTVTGMANYDDYKVDIPSADILAREYTVALGDMVVRPTIETLEKDPDDEWTSNTTVDINGTVASNSSDSVDVVRYSTDPDDYALDTYGSKAATATEITPASDAFTFDVSSAINFSDTYYVWVYSDGAGNGKSLRYEIDVNIDVEDPEVTGIEIERINTDPVGRLINFLTFGTFFNESVRVTVDANDDSLTGVSAGIEEITLHYRKGLATPSTKTISSTSETFTLSLADLSAGAEQEIWVTATDKAGNESAEARPGDLGITGSAQSEFLTLESTPPTVIIAPQQAADYTEPGAGGKKWYTDKHIPIQIDVADADAGLNSVTIKINGTTAITEDLTDWGQAVKPSETYSFYTDDFGALGEGKTTIEVTATDNAGNTRTSSVDLYFDTARPTIRNFEIEAAGAAPMDALSFLSYGTFFNDKVLVTVTAADGTNGSGIDTIALYVGGTLLDTKAADSSGRATFELPAGAISDGQILLNGKALTALATDKATNAMTAPDFKTLASSPLKSNKLTIETEKPTISVSVASPVYTDGGKSWYSQPVSLGVTVKDSGAGIRSVGVTLNGKTIAKDYSGKAVNTAFYKNQTFDQSFTFHTSQATRAADGSYTLVITVVDNAGNTFERTRAVYIDTAAPVITDFTFDSAGAVQNVNSQDAPVEKKDYGYYFKAETRVTITAQDPAPGAGVKSITYYTVDNNGTKSRETTVRTADAISFVMPANFKGQVFAKATDNVGRTPTSFVSPNSVVIESPDKHLEEGHIRFAQAGTPYTDNDGLALYAGDTTVGLTVTDTFSGLRRVEWAVTAPYDTSRNFSHSIDIAGSNTLTGDTAGWGVTRTERNLATEMAGTVTVANNSNAITLWVKITDRAGNTTEDSITFSIDKTAPTISVSYDNNDQDAQFPNFYKADRTATIVITERNFRPEDVYINITNTENSIPQLSGWVTSWNASNPDLTTHTATLRYAVDGDYTFDIRCSDNADNAAAAFAQQAFTIDKTLPRITVTYDNDQFINGQYYAAGRTATITITEHNFEGSRVQITGTATDDGTQIAFPTLSGWSSSGDVHTATIAYTADARYTFTIAYIDKAGNKAADFALQEFVVDQTAPTLEIVGVADKSANNGEVIPIVRFYDTNYAADTVSISLSGAVRQAVPLIGSFADQHNGQVYTFEDFVHEKEIDDIYTLTASLTDLAGNQTTETITFSVNRFGSVYVFDAALQAIEGTYVQNEVDIVVTETNVDTLRKDTVNVKMTYNGVPGDLVEGEDYTVEHVGGGGAWSQYLYNIPKEMFAGEGSYVVTLYSVDEAGNVNENIQESKKAEIAFGIDKTAPAIVPIGIEDGRQYPVESLDVEVSVTDNLVLSDVAVYLNDEKIETQVAENQTLTIPASGSKQSIRIVAADAAGNESVVEITDFLVTTSLLSRWYNNTPLFIGTLCAIAGVVAVVVFLIRRAKARARA